MSRVWLRLTGLSMWAYCPVCASLRTTTVMCSLCRTLSYGTVAGRDATTPGRGNDTVRHYGGLCHLLPVMCCPSCHVCPVMCCPSCHVLSVMCCLSCDVHPVMSCHVTLVVASRSTAAAQPHQCGTTTHLLHPQVIKFDNEDTNYARPKHFSDTYTTRTVLHNPNPKWGEVRQQRTAMALP